MDEKERNRILIGHHSQMQWAYWLLLVLGVWMLFSPLTFSYGIGTVEPAAGRDVWLSPDARVMVMTWSDIISGVLLIFFGWRALTPDRPVSIWICCFVGIWLNLAPIFFWAPTAAIYINGTLVGMTVIILSVIIPDIPNFARFKKSGAEVPAGWSYNPSSLPQRSILIFLAFCGWIISRYLGAYQLGYIDTAWDPFFGDGTREVLESDLSESWPVSDGAFGAFAYTMEVLIAWMGGVTRWRTMPWTVTFFGILVIPLGLVHIFLVISQPVTVGAWCTLCLLAAGILMPMIALAVDEVAAMIQHMKEAKRRGNSFSEIFWKGGDPEEDNIDERTPDIAKFPVMPGQVIRSAVWGVSIPPTLALSALLGAWLMFAPDAFGIGIEAAAANINHLAGALIVVFSVISMAEVIRRLRYVNILLGLVVAIVPWFMADGSQSLNLNGAFAGLFVILLSIPKGRIREKYGMWDKYIS